METISENDVVQLITDRLVLGTVLVYETIKGNVYEFWSESTSKKDMVTNMQSKSVLNKLKSACEYRPDMALELFDGEIMNASQNLTPKGVSLYHSTKFDIAKRFNSQDGTPELEGKSALVLEMSPIICPKSCSSGRECFSDFVVIIYHHIMSHGYNCIDLVFDCYFEWSMKEGTRNKQGTGSMFVFEGDNTPGPSNMEQTFM